MKVSFIIPHKGRLDMLKATIESILALDYDLDDLEILVISQNESLLPEELVNHHLDKVKVYTRPPEFTISASRNFGAAQALGEYFAFLDADVELSKNWLNMMFEELNKEGRVLVSAHQRCLDSAPKLEKLRTVLSNAVVDASVEFLPGRNLFLHKTSFEQVGGFPEHLITCEDYYFTDKVNNLGELFYSGKADYIHLGEDKEWKQLFDKEIWRGQSNLQSLKGRKIPLSEYPSLLVPLWLFFFFCCFVLGLFVAPTSLSVFSIFAILVPIILYSVRLLNLGRGLISLATIIQFYSIYFAARTIGTVAGVLKSFNVRNAE